MNPVSELFEKYTSGLLDDSAVEALNRQLVGIYFDSPGELTREELEYSEDLVIELYAKKLLEEKYTRKFKSKLEEESSLLKKFSIFKELLDADLSIHEKRSNQIAESEASDEQEEAQLKEILQEVIRKAGAEKEKSAIKEWLDNLRAGSMKFFEEVVSIIRTRQQQVRLITVMASFLLLAMIAWFFLPSRTDHGNEFANAKDSSIMKEDKMKVQTHQDSIAYDNEKISGEIKPRVQMSENKELRSPGKRSQREKISDLLAANYSAPQFDQTFVRGGETTSASDSLFEAAEIYNDAILKDDVKQFDQCIRILSDLLKKKSFSDATTISEISFYLGNSYLSKGIKENDQGLINYSLRSFEGVHHNSNLFISSRYFSAVAFASADNVRESIRILDSLMQVHYYNHGKVKELRDSLNNIIRQK